MNKYLKFTIAIAITLTVTLTAFFFIINKPTHSGNAENPILPDQGKCNGETMVCTDGTVVKRSGANCEFEACPDPGTSVDTSEEIMPEEKPVNFSFAIMGDTKSFESGSKNNLSRAVSEISKMNPDAVFIVGDLVEDCSVPDACHEEYNEWKEIMKPILPKTYEVVGNHDREGGNAVDLAWQNSFDLPQNGPDGFSEMVYSFDKFGAHFAILDTEKPKESDIDPAQLAWLKNDLDQNKKPLTFVFFHEPAFPVGSKIGNSIDMNPKNRDELWSIMDSHNVTAVFSGHEHIFSRRLIDKSVFPGAKNKIYQFVVGNTDAPIDEKPKKGMAEYYYLEHSFALVKFENGKIILELYDLKGNLVNSFSYIPAIS
jgi:hypothetical protein